MPEDKKETPTPLPLQEGVVLRYAIEDAGRNYPHLGLFLRVGVDYEIGVDLPGDFGQRLLETGVCRIVSAEELQAEFAVLQAQEVAKAIPADVDTPPVMTEEAGVPVYTPVMTEEVATPPTTAPAAWRGGGGPIRTPVVSEPPVLNASQQVDQDQSAAV